MDKKVKEVEEFARGIFSENNMEWFVKLHLEYVDALSMKLARMKNADEDVVKLSVWLHDINHRNDNVSEKHHIENSEFAAKFLAERKFGDKTIKDVIHCILTHRCKDDYRPETLEAKILASADAMSHIENFSLLLFCAFIIRKNNIEEAYEWLSGKIDRDWNRKILVPEGREMIRGKYEEVTEVLKKMKSEMESPTDVNL